MVEVNALNYIFMVPAGGKEILKLDRVYVESKSAWREETDRVGRWMTDKVRNGSV